MRRSIYLTLILILVMGTVAGAQPQQTDVVVVGGGIAGLTAALEAADAGAEVVVLEKMAFLGGSALISGGVIYAAGTRFQEELGIEDNAEDMFNYWMTLNHWIVDPALVRIVADGSADAVHWLMDLGVEFPPIIGTVDQILYNTGGIYISGVEDVPRGHTAAGAGVGLTRPIIELANANPNITILLETTGTDLIQEDGKIVGVEAKNDQGKFVINSNSVVLATGGLGHNEELQRRYMPEIAATGSRVNVISVQGVTGDGIVMGEKAGAELVGMDQGALMIQPSFAPGLGTPGWLMFVNKNGQRFIREDAAHPVMNEVTIAQEDGLAWAICDDSARTGAWAEIDQYVEQGIVAKADTIEELAKELGISPRGLQNAANKYNADVQQGNDNAFFKDSRFLQSVDTPPFYGVQLVQSMIGVPTGGLRISTKAEVLTPEGDVIPGLYAAGETTGGILGRYPGSGAAITDAIIFGKIAGENAAK